MENKNGALLTTGHLFFIVHLPVKTWRMGFSLFRRGEGEKMFETGRWSKNPKNFHVDIF
jgi:hypothetical protein